MSLFVRPQEDINYNFILGAYAVATAIGVLFFVLEKHFEVSQVEGFYLVFAPFAPCLLWSVYMRSRWLRERGAEDGTKKKED